jgi:hypothetical protein
MNRSSAVEVAAWKLRTAFMFMGAAIGFVADWILDQFV